MKNKIKGIFKKSIVLGAVATAGVGIGYAASTAYEDLDAIKHNFDYVMNQNTNKQAEIDGLNLTIADLQAQIEELEQNQNNSGKQERIKELEEQVEGLIAERDILVAERDNAINDNAELERAINDLRIYTDMFVEQE